MKSYLFFGILAVIVLAIIIVFSINGANGALKIGLVAPLSGDTATWGYNTVAGVQLAIDEFNAKGGINGKKIELIVEDGLCTSEGGAKAYNALLNNYDLVGMLGPVCSAEAGSGLPMGVTQNIPNVIATASSPGLTALGNNIFRVYPSDAFQGVYAADYIYNKLGKKKVSIIYVNNNWGQEITNKFSAEYTKLGGVIESKDSVLQDQLDVKDLLIKVKNTNPELLYLPVYPKNLLSILKTKEEINLNVPIVGGDATLSEDSLKSGLGEGVMFTSPKFNLPNDFKTKIMAQKGNDFLVNVAAPFGYDAAKVLLSAMENANSLSHEDVIKELKKTSMEGISNPLIEFDEQGDLKNAAFQVMKIENKESILVE